MHEYYSRNQKKLKKEMNNYLKFISTELEAETNKKYQDLVEEIWQLYKTDILQNFPYIGGKSVSGTKNMTGAYYFVALGEVCQKYGITLERWGYLATICYQRYFAKNPLFIRNIIGKMFLNPEKAIKMLKKKDDRNAKNALINPGSFETKIQPPTEEYPIIYHTTVCPLVEFAKKYHYTQYMPYLCNLDYVMFEALNVPFYREKTCADGDGYCDFKLKPGAAIVKPWPCHALNKNNLLK